MPFNSSTPVLYYNKDILNDAGVEPPKTYEEMEVVAQKLKAKGHAAFSQSHTPWIFFENFKSRHNQQLADKFISRVREMLKSFKIPTHLDDLKVSDIPSIAKSALDEAHQNYPVPKYMNQNTCENLLNKMVA